MPKKQTNMRLSEVAKELLKALTKLYGINETSVVEMAIRELAKKEDIKY